MSLIPPSIERLLATVQGVLAGATVLMCMGAAYSASALLQQNPSWLFAILFVLAVFFLVVVHEVGHLLAARMAGMALAGMQIGPIFLQAKKRGWSVHWSRSRRPTAGLAIAYPDPTRSLPRQFVLMTIGGPLANVVCAAAFAVPWLLLPNGPGRIFVAALSLASVFTAMGNLIPTSKFFPSDGFQLLRWHRGVPDDDLGVIYARVMGRSVFGTTADQLPEGEIAALEAQPPPAQLLGLWFRLKAAQNRREWTIASALSSRLDAALEAMSSSQVASVSTFVAILRTEIAFSSAVLDRDSSKLESVILSKADASWARHLPPRIEALRAALAGDVCARDEALARSAARAAEMPDLALEKSERSIRASIVALGVGLRVHPDTKALP